MVVGLIFGIMTCIYLQATTVVGPPYAITSISPTSGPMTGGTEITIVGLISLIQKT